ENAARIVLPRSDRVDRLRAELLEFVRWKGGPSKDVRDQIQHHGLVAGEELRRDIAVLEARPGGERSAEAVHQRRDLLGGALPRPLPQQAARQGGDSLLAGRVG